MNAATAVAAFALALGSQGGAYIANGNDYDFSLVNSGTTPWRSFYLVAPSGTAFVGGTTGNEASATCVVGPPTLRSAARAASVNPANPTWTGQRVATHRCASIVPNVSVRPNALSVVTLSTPSSSIGCARSNASRS